MLSQARPANPRSRSPLTVLDRHRLSTGDHRPRASAVPASGPRQPSSPRRADRGLGADRPGVHRPRLLLGPSVLRAPPLQRAAPRPAPTWDPNPALAERVAARVRALRAAHGRRGSDSGRPRDRIRQRPRSAHLAGRGALPGPARGEGPRACRVDRSTHGRRARRGAPVRRPRRAARQRARLNLALDERETRIARQDLRGRFKHRSDPTPMAPERPDSRDPEQRPDPDARWPRSPPRRSRSARPAQGLSRRGAGRRQDLRDAATRARAAPAGHRRGGRHRRDPRPRGDRRRCSTASRCCRAAASSTRARRLRNSTSTPCSRASPSVGAGRRAGPQQRARRRHERRYQDVEELLDAGIDVYTTVNIQHLESLNDVVAQHHRRARARDRARRASSTGRATSCWSTCRRAELIERLQPGQGLRAGPGAHRAAERSSRRRT